MSYEVLVVGGGIGGLTTAALLAARGVSVCLFERESRGGGCAAGFAKLGYDFETTAGLYAAWGPGEVHERVFSELSVAPPEARKLSPAYAVRLPDATDVPIGGGRPEEFEESLRAAFPECAARAVEFYRELEPLADALHRSLNRFPALAETSRFQRMKLAAAEPRAARRILAATGETAAAHLAGTSPRFRRFVDAQLELFALAASDECSYLYAAVALTLPRRGLYSLGGGADALADALTESITRSGGTVRFDAPVLRLAYDAAGRAVGVDLLSGETVGATRAVVSNLTVWDTYGKLVGSNRTPPEVRARLKSLRGAGAYLLFLAAEEGAVNRLPAEHVVALTDWQENSAFDPAGTLFTLGSSPAWDARAPAGHRAVTVSTYAEAEDWFAYHEDESEHEAQDQSALEACWGRLHAALPELGAGVEVVETLTPRGYYERTRRKLGMVGGTPRTPEAFAAAAAVTHRTPLPNLFLVGDTTFPGNGVAAVTHSALAVANELAPPASVKK